MRTIISSPTSAIKGRKKKSTKETLSPIHVDDDDIRGAIRATLKMSEPTVNKVNALKGPATSRIEDLSLNKLFEQMDNNKNHLKFLQDNAMCSTEEKDKIMTTIKEIYMIISSRMSNVCLAI